VQLINLNSIDFIQEAHQEEEIEGVILLKMVSQKTEELIYPKTLFQLVFIGFKGKLGFKILTFL